eukprot:CAMPEP_0118638218 /NCGR_PEP_ID=MMETSP0785-20121206/3560_1 /TAXON_ID=91992 /ORGANISM="Bolidomonas pacifica, Strain CCMP 1866" /LENGTH=506 /DNA_ID=CAMNT_0006529439 /DNA_START=89 /DNA_END=1605 /DNA_ORIENTATION=-
MASLDASSSSASSSSASSSSTSSSSLPAQDYKSAVSSLYNLQSKTASAILSNSSKRQYTVHAMRTYLDRLSLPYTLTSPPSPKIIHVTGTKGKGSTVAFTESLLRNAYGLNTATFTSPHLINPRERIRLNGMPISEDEFASCYWSMYNKLQEASPPSSSLPPHPTYFRYLTLLSLYVFHHHTYPPPLNPKCDVIILEVGMGGRYDATNVYDYKDVGCVTTLDLDHTRVLGDTIEKIAWEKGGIMKPSCLTIVSPQPKGPEDVLLRQCAVDVGAEVEFLPDPSDPSPSSVADKIPNMKGWDLGLKGDFQIYNARLAVAMCKHVMGGLDEDAVREALRVTSWPGRCQYVTHPKHSFFLDGAHTHKSMEVCLEWFSSTLKTSRSRVKKVLIFNCSHERSPVDLLSLIKTYPGVKFDVVMFAKSDDERPSAMPKPTASELLGSTPTSDGTDATSTATWQETLAAVYPQIPPITPSSSPLIVTTASSITEALGKIQEPSNFLCCGSLYIVG